MQPLEALSLDADTLSRATAAAVTYCDAQGAASFADLVERASRLIVHQQAVWPWKLVPVGCGSGLRPCLAPARGPWRLFMAMGVAVLGVVVRPIP